MVDDAAFVTASEGFILFADKKLNTVYALKKKAFAPRAAYTAADGGPFVDTIDLTIGFITPIVTGLKNPGGLVFVDTSQHDRDDSREEDRNACHDRDWRSTLKRPEYNNLKPGEGLSQIRLLGSWGFLESVPSNES